MNLIGIYNWFIYLVLYIFLAKEFGNQQNEKRNKKNQTENFKEGERLDNDRGNSE